MTVTSVLRDWKATRYVGDCDISVEGLEGYEVCR